MAPPPRALAESDSEDEDDDEDIEEVLGDVTGNDNVIHIYGPDIEELIIKDENQLEGLPQDFRDQAAKLAESEGHSGKWMFKPTRVSMYPFLTYSTQRDLREKLYNSYLKRGDNDNDKDNKHLAIKMSDLRIQRANLLGYKTHADFVLEDTMAKNIGRVKNLLYQVWEPGIARAKKEAEDMLELIQQEGGNFKLAAWDWWHYSEKIRQLKYDFSEEEIKPYFSETKVLQGAFDVATKLFDITFHFLFVEVQIYSLLYFF